MAFLTLGSIVVDNTVNRVVNLSEYNGDDWAYWGDTSSDTPDDRKSGGGSTISMVSSGGRGSYGNDNRNIEWGDGTNTAAQHAYHRNGLYINSTGQYFTITLPASATPRRARLILAIDNATSCELFFSLSDSSASTVTDTTLSNTGNQFSTVDFTYQAASASQSVSVRWKLIAGSAIRLIAAMVAETASGGSLSKTSSATATSPIDLTALSADDWAAWGYTGTTMAPGDRKSGGGSTIGGGLLIGGMTQYGGFPVGFTWSDGTPTGSATAETYGLYTDPGFSLGAFLLNFPSDQSVRDLTLWIGGASGDVKWTASLSDGSAADVTETITFGGGLNAQKVVINYAGGLPSKRLQVKVECLSGANQAFVFAAAVKAQVTDAMLVGAMCL